MNRRFWVVAAIGLIVGGTSGCVTCGHQQFAQVWQSEAEHELPVSCRKQVYVFLIHGLTPSCVSGLELLRDKLAHHGFAKVGVGEALAGVGITREIREIHAHEPDAQFVLVGYDWGGWAASSLARELHQDGIPIAAVVLLNPVHSLAPCGVRTLLITSGKAPAWGSSTDRVVIPDTNHFRLPSHPTTVGTITGLLHEIAADGVPPTLDPVPEWHYLHAPAMRPFVPPQGQEWDFLTETGTVPLPIGMRLSTQPVPSTQHLEATKSSLTPR